MSKTWLSYLRISVPAIVCVLLFWLLLFNEYTTHLNSQQRELKLSGYNQLSLVENALKRELTYVSQELQRVRYASTLTQFLSSPSAQSTQTLQQDWLNLLTFAPNIQQIRYIDSSGMEKIRVSRQNVGYPPKVDNLLQNKRERDYVRQSLDLLPNSVFVTPFDLNQEFGKIEQPIVPTLRFIIKLDYADDRSGIVVINYYAQSLFSDIDQLASQQLRVINHNGFYLNGQDAWGWLLNDSPGLSTTDPTLWRTLKALPHNQPSEIANTLVSKVGFNALSASIPPIYLYYALPDQTVSLGMFVEDIWFWIVLLTSILFVVLAIYITKTLNALTQQTARAIASEEKAQQALSVKSTFLASMSHEIRTPLNGILGFFQLLVNEPLSLRQLRYAKEGFNTTKLLTQIINDILDVSKIEVQKLQLNHTRFSLDEVMREIGVLMTVNLDNKPLDIWFDLDENLPTHFIGDEVRIKQVLVNLTNNALKFTHEGHIIVKAKLIEHVPNGSIIHFSVTDTGIGLNKEQIGRIFESFEQADRHISKEFGGTGLGLSISKGLLQLMNSELHVTSAIGVGSTFSFELTLKQATDTQTRAKRFANLSNAVPDMRNLHFLFVNHNEVGTVFLKRMCSQFGWTAVSATTPQDAARAILMSFETKPFDVVLIDKHLASPHDWALVKHLKQLCVKHDIPLFFMVVTMNNELNDAYEKQEMLLLDGHFIKPITPSTLFDTISRVKAKVHLATLNMPELAKPRQFTGKHFLLVEDNMINQEVVVQMLQHLNGHVTVLDNGQQAVDELSQGHCPYDLILVDMQMPVLDGVSATKLIRDIPYCRAVPIIALTANAQASDKQTCLHAGMNAHLAKPFDQAALLQTISEYL